MWIIGRWGVRRRQISGHITRIGHNLGVSSGRNVSKKKLLGKLPASPDQGSSRRRTRRRGGGRGRRR